ncbi:SDR family oxidoreductase [Antrihabitans cavernicola]|uniref:SDR family oxidoreductase n=1 Tax=Antrihabitans cavernicola TaxID=2495913 RepID=A0A5A7SH38_9NOCA|nr:SDR family oxidoreductase [Spelaeibacter cavernicola]KAA0023805.1 SDR family oxidoreductase [Spelaeibacter cavernicola]
MPKHTVVIAGGHGKIAHHLIERLTARGDDSVALIRNPDHSAEVARWGARPAVIDLESSSPDEVAAVLDGATAVVFAAGAGPNSGVARKDSVDRGAAVLLAQAAEKAGVRRFLQISSFGAGEPAPADSGETWKAYIDAKTAAEEDLRTRDLDATILRPGGLTDDAATGKVALSEPPLERGSIPRDDVAAVLVALLDASATAGKTLMVTEGSTPIAESVAAS